MSTDGKIEIFNGDRVMDVVIENMSCDICPMIENVCLKLLKGNTNYPLMLEELLDGIVLLTNSSIGNIISFDSHTSTLVCVSIGGKNLDSFDETFNMKKICTDDYIRKHVTISNNREKDPRLCSNSSSYKNFMSIPLRPQGVLVVASSEKEYTSSDMSHVLQFRTICTDLLIKTCDDGKTLASELESAKTSETMKDRFLATMSHELRTPLNGIMGMVTLFPEAGPMNSKQSEYISNLTECAIELTSLLNNILDYSKMYSDRLVIQKQPFSVSSLITDTIMMMEGSITEKGLQMVIDVPDDIPILVGDRQRIMQILCNLLNNSCKFTDKGFITVSVKGYPIECVEEFDLRKWNITFKVQDTGIGIPLDEQDKIFDAFHQIKTSEFYLSNSGIGLGLSIVKELIRLMDGDISVYSSGEYGSGSTFTFNIIMEEEISDINDKLKGSKILIVDDRADMRLQLSDMMWKWECIPQAVSSAIEALQYLQYGTKFDAVIVDICMPGMTGVELAQTLRIKYPRLPLIGTSSVDLNSGEEYFDFYMYKPVDRYKLYSALIKCVSNPEEVKAESPKTRLKKKEDIKIVIAEDDKHNIFTLIEMLKSLGYSKKNITVTNDGLQCIEAVKKVSPDIILMDIIMPNMDGIEASHIIKLMPDPPLIIAVSAAVTISDRTRGQHAGIDSYINKPIIKEKLEAALSIRVL